MIHYIEGDLFEKLPYKNGKIKFIPHVCNDQQYNWGSGFVVPLGRKWPVARDQYYQLGELRLGRTQLVEVEDDIIVCNMIAQHGTIRDKGNIKPIKYQALVECMADIKHRIEFNTSPEIHCPMFGAKRAGGSWEFIEELIEEIWGNFPVFVYRFVEKP